MTIVTQHPRMAAGFATLALASLGLIGCRKPQPEPVPAPAVTSAPAQAPSNQDDQSLRQAEADRLKAEQEAARKAEEARLTAYKTAAEQALKDIHFDFDSSDIRDADKPVLQGVAGFMKAYPMAKLRVEGNCDERGTIEYNLALGERRANAVKAYLVALGVEDGRLSITSYGKEKPLCTDHTEDCWFLNRRDHSVLQ